MFIHNLYWNCIRLCPLHEIGCVVAYVWLWTCDGGRAELVCASMDLGEWPIVETVQGCTGV